MNPFAWIARNALIIAPIAVVVIGYQIRADLFPSIYGHHDEQAEHAAAHDSESHAAAPESSEHGDSANALAAARQVDAEHATPAAQTDIETDSQGNGQAIADTTDNSASDAHDTASATAANPEIADPETANPEVVSPEVVSPEVATQQSPEAIEQQQSESALGEPSAATASATETPVPNTVPALPAEAAARLVEHGSDEGIERLAMKVEAQDYAQIAEREAATVAPLDATNLAPETQADTANAESAAQTTPADAASNSAKAPTLAEAPAPVPGEPTGPAALPASEPVSEPTQTTAASDANVAGAATAGTTADSALGARLIHDARRFFWVGNYDASIKTYEQLIAAQPNNWKAYGELGNVFYRVANLDGIDIVHRQEAIALAVDSYEQAAILMHEGGMPADAWQLSMVISHLSPKRAWMLAQQFDQKAKPADAPEKTTNDTNASGN